MFWIGVVISLGALLGVPLWRNWIQSRLRQATDWTLDIIRSLFILGGIMISVVSYVQSGHEKEALRRSLQTTQGEITETRQGLTEAQQKQSAAEQALREVQAQQRPRTLSPEQRRLLNEQLRKGPKGPIHIHFPAGDAEAQRFADQFSTALIAAWWTVTLIHDGPLLGGNLPVGLQLAASRPKRGGPDAEMPPHGKFLLQALRNVGLEVSLGIPHLTPAEVAHLVVGAKPQPR